MKLATIVRSVSTALLFFSLFAVRVPIAQSQCCLVPDIGGTAQVPPGCPDGYDDPQAIKLNGLPPGEPVLGTLSIINIHNVVEAPGGGLGGTTQTWDAVLILQLDGQPPFVYSRVFAIPIVCTSDAGPRIPFTPLQSFPMELTHLQGQIPIGDPDFDLLRITAGSGFGLPSPGHTTLVSSAGQWSVDSFFDITYRIDYIGHPGGPFAGSSNSQTESLQPFDMCHDRPTPAKTKSWGAIKSLYR